MIVSFVRNVCRSQEGESEEKQRQTDMHSEREQKPREGQA